MTRQPKRLDLDGASREALELDELLDWIASFARSAVGRRRVAALAPAADGPLVAERLAAAREILRLHEQQGAVVRDPSPDPSAALEELEVEGVRLDGKVARRLALALEVAMQVRARLRALGGQDYPLLRALGEEVPDLRAESATVLRGTDPDGHLLDDASPELRRLREQAARVGERLRRTLQRYLREPGSESVIRDDFVTQRNGRFVIPVRSDAPRPVRGIVHATSSSGATRFVEPLETVEPNNELVRLIEEERSEQLRILTEWSDAFRARGDEVGAAIDALGRADALQALARFAEAAGGVVPSVGPARALRLEGMRHPLLQRRLAAEGGRCVPSTLTLEPADRVLVLSGPNTGGKTVALKAVGLAVLMAQAGIPVTADRAELPLFRQVRADIGDHQSIEANLSTYSAHVRAIAESIRERRPPALFLFDELGTGTEPAEGGALARAILESLVEPGITVMATTHLGPVKAWAVTDEGARCAALDFDTETLSPSYRIVMDVAGRSAGLDIAQRLGVDPAVVERARSLLDPEQREGEDYLRRLREALSEAERGAEEIRRGRRELDEERERFRARQERAAAARGREADRQLSRALEEFRRRARRELEGLRDPGERARADRRRVRADRRLSAERARRRSDLVAPDGEAAQAGPPVDRSRLGPGDRVWVRSLARAGEVRETRGGEAEVLLGGMVCRVRLDDLHEPPAEGEAAGSSGRPPGRVEVSSNAVAASCPAELLLVGRRVDEALLELDRYLDAATVAGRDEVRVIHGHGTGRLRTAIRRHLDDHAQVRSHRPGAAAEGGDGATVVLLG